MLRLRRMAGRQARSRSRSSRPDATPVTRLVLDSTARHRAVGHRRDAAGHATILLAGQTVVVAGFGCLRGSASRSPARGPSARGSSMTEVDPVRALDAVLRGFRGAADWPTRRRSARCSSPRPVPREVITGQHLAVMRDGAILANSRPLRRRDRRAGAGRPGGRRAVADVRPHADAYELSRRPPPAAAGRGPRSVNLVAANGPPARGHGPGVRDRGARRWRDSPGRRSGFRRRSPGAF